MKLFDTTLNRWIAKALFILLRRVPSGVTPNMITLVGGVVSLAALGVGLLYHSVALLCWLSLAALLFDVFDGQLARFRGETTHIGKVLDAGVDIMLSILIVASLFALEKDTSLLGVLLLMVLYALRFFAVIKNVEIEIGGLRPSLIVGLLAAPLVGLSFNAVLGIFLAWNAISISLSLRVYITSGSKNSVGI